MADFTVVWEDKIPGLSQTDCLTGKWSEGDRGPCATCQSVMQVYLSNWVSAVQAVCQQNLRLEIRGARGWSPKGGKCQRTHLSDPAIVFYGQTGLQPLCIRKALVMRLSADLKCPSNKSRAELSTEVAHQMLNRGGTERNPQQ